MHPVICRKLGSERSQHVCSCSVISTIIPAYCLHVRSKVSVSFSCDIHTEEFSVTSACFFYCWCYICCCFLSLILDSGICSCFSCLKCKAVTVFHCIFQTVGVCCYCCCCCIGAQLYFAISAFQHAIIGNYVVFLAECIIIFCFYGNRDIFQAINFIVMHIYSCSVCFCDSSSVKSYSCSICQLNGILIYPCRNRISASVFCHNGCLCLEASSVKSVVCSCSCYRIKSTFVKFIMTIHFLRRSCISCCIYAFICPVLCPSQACVYITISVCFYKCCHCCIKMIKSFVNLCLCCILSCKKFLCLLKLCLHC